MLPPSQNAVNGAKLRTAHYGSWEQLSQAMLHAGISFETLRIIKVSLDNEGFDIQEVTLTNEQLTVLGFGTIQ